MDQGHFSPESQHQPRRSPLRPTQNTWGKFGLITAPQQEQQLANLYWDTRCPGPDFAGVTSTKANRADTGDKNGY